MAVVDKESLLLPFLQKKWSDVSRERLKRLLRDGRILVNGNSVTRFDYILKEGDRVDVGPSVANRGGLKNRFVRLVYEDRYLVVIEKNIGILSMASSHHAFCVKTVLDGYFERSKQRCRAHVVHRLDRDTSGLMIYAKSREVQKLFEADWKSIVYDRRYVAVACGLMEREQDTLVSWLKDNKQYFTYSSPVDNGGKMAITHYRVIKRGECNSLVELKLDTGRKNQIRVQLSDIHHPVLGDRKYGLPCEDDNEACSQRLCLHAMRLHFTHPVTNEDMCFDTPIPSEFLNKL